MSLDPDSEGLFEKSIPLKAKKISLEKNISPRKKKTLLLATGATSIIILGLLFSFSQHIDRTIIAHKQEESLIKIAKSEKIPAGFAILSIPSDESFHAIASGRAIGLTNYYHNSALRGSTVYTEVKTVYKLVNKSLTTPQICKAFIDLASTHTIITYGSLNLKGTTERKGKDCLKDGRAIILAQLMHPRHTFVFISIYNTPGSNGSSFWTIKENFNMPFSFKRSK